jgi:hypothetical protein
MSLFVVVVVVVVCERSFVCGCYWKLENEAVDHSETQRNGNTQSWKPLQSNGNEGVTVDISVYQ